MLGRPVLFAPLTLLALIAVSCGNRPSGTDTGVTLDCPTHDGATFELGTGPIAYQPITDGQLLPITPGVQGGCHFFVALRTDGFAERRFKVQYEVFWAASSTTTGSRSSFTVRLRPVDGMPGVCETLGITAFLIQPWRFEDKPVIVEVNVTDDEGRTASQRKMVTADWPDDLADNACGPRT